MIMPNHVHGIVVIVDDGEFDVGAMGADLESARTDVGYGVGTDFCVGAGSEPAPTENTHSESAPTKSRRQSLSEIVRQFKTFSARRINEKRGTPGIRVWQRNYWEHIIRNDEDYENISAYIINNPGQWELDSLHVGNKT